MATVMLSIAALLRGECVPATSTAECLLNQIAGWLVIIIAIASTGDPRHIGIDQDMKTDILYSVIQQCSK